MFCYSLQADNAHTHTDTTMTLAWQMVECAATDEQGLKEGFSSCGVQTTPMKTESVLEPGSCLKIQTETQYRGWLNPEPSTGSLTEMPLEALHLHSQTQLINSWHYWKTWVCHCERRLVPSSPQREMWNEPKLMRYTHRILTAPSKTLS